MPDTPPMHECVTSPRCPHRERLPGAPRFADVQTRMNCAFHGRSPLRLRRISLGQSVKEPAMSMIRDLRAAVRPVPAQGQHVVRLRPTHPRPRRATRAVVDCAVYRDGAGATASRITPAARRCAGCARDGGFVWIGLHEPTEAEFAGIAERVRAAPAGRRGRRPGPPAAQAGAVRRHAVHRLQDHPLRRARPNSPPPARWWRPAR